MEPPNGWERWRGATDQRLSAIESTVMELAQDVKALQAISTSNHALLEEVVRKCREDSGIHKPPTSEHVTFRWLIEKIGLPLLLAINALILGLLANHMLVP